MIAAHRGTAPTDREIPRRLFNGLAGILCVCCRFIPAHSGMVPARSGISVVDNDNVASRLEPVQCPHCRKINPPSSNYCFSCGQRLTDVVIDTDDEIQQSVLRDNPDILRQLIDERIAEMKRKGEL